MDDDQITERRQSIYNRFLLDNLLCGPGTMVLRRKFKEIYTKVNDGEKWVDGPESGQKIRQSKWGSSVYDRSNPRQQEMIRGGDIRNWDLSCLQSVIHQMVTTASPDNEQKSNSSDWSLDIASVGQATPVNWDPKWKAQMFMIHRLTNIRNFKAHRPNAMLSQEEFDEKWSDAVAAIKGLGARQKEIDKVLQDCQSAFNLSNSTQPDQGQGQGQLSDDVKKLIEDYQAKIEKLELENQSCVKDSKNEVEDQMSNEKVTPVLFNRKNESRAKGLSKRGNLACRSEYWDKALEFYTKALDIPDISDDLRKKIFISRSWVHLKILEMPKSKSRFDFYLSGTRESRSETKKTPNNKKNDEKLSSQSPSSLSKREPKFVDEKLLEIDDQQSSGTLTEEVKEFHLTAGMADAESALQLSPDQKSTKAFYRLAQFHQLKGDWSTALTFYDLALGQSQVDDSQLELDRNICQLELLNEVEVEEFNWIPGRRNQTMAGLKARKNPQHWSKAILTIETTVNDPRLQHFQIIGQFLKAHFLAQGLSWNDQGRNHWLSTWEGMRATVWTVDFLKVVELYDRAGIAGFPAGVYNLGLLLQEGHGVQRDFSEAVRLFKMAANFTINNEEVDDKTPGWKKEGILEAQYRLGLCYEFGLGVGKDDRKALHWYETASLGDYARASRKLGDIYSKGLLGVSEDIDTAFFFWEHAKQCGDLTTMTLKPQHILDTSPVTWGVLAFNLCRFSRLIELNSQKGTPTQVAAAFKRKRDFESTLATVFQRLTTHGGFGWASEIIKDKHPDGEPEELSWNIPTFVNNSLRTIHLLQLAQTPEFTQKLKGIPDWRKEFKFTKRLVEASNACHKGLTAVQKLNKLYRDAVIKANGDEPEMKTDYPPDLRSMSGVDPTILDQEAKLVAEILTAFTASIKLVGTAFFGDLPTMTLIINIVRKIFYLEPEEGIAETQQEMFNGINSGLLYNCSLAIAEPSVDGEKALKELQEICWKREKPLSDSFRAISGAAVEGSLGQFEEAAGYMTEALKKSVGASLTFPEITKCDLLFVQAVCVKSAALTRGVNTANRKKVKEAMGIFEKFLSICPKDEPRRAEAHYHLALCALYLEKMKVKGQVKSSAKVILDKVLPHFNQGEEAEQTFPWKDLHCPDKSPVKIHLQKQIKELENLVKKVPAQNLTSESEGESEKSESVSVGKFLHPYFKFPTSALFLTLWRTRRVEVITQFRKLFKAAHTEVTVGFPIQLDKLKELLRIPGSPFNGVDVGIVSWFSGCYEIIEPILHTRIPDNDHPETEQILAFTVVEDESGAVFNLRFKTKYREEKGEAGQFGEFQVGDRIIIYWPTIRLDLDGGMSLFVENADAQVFHLPIISKEQQQEEERNGEEIIMRTRKCGLCRKVGGMLKNCQKCKVVSYCDKQCQASDWNVFMHKEICHFLQPRQQSSKVFLLLPRCIREFQASLTNTVRM